MSVGPERLAIFGITGRMGQSILRALSAAPRWRLSGALASAHSSRLGADANAQGTPTGVCITADPVTALAGASIAIDFSAAAAVAGHTDACAQAGVPLLVGTTALPPECLAALGQASKLIPVLVAPNTSVGVGVLATALR